MTIHSSRVKLLLLALVVTFVLLRLWLHNFPNTDLNVGGYNIHHLFTGLLLITLGGIPLAVWQGESRWLDLATLLFGVGLSLALDEWVFLIATDGTNAAYLLPVSFWGGVVLLALACGYVWGQAWLARRQRNAAAPSSSPAAGRR
jgi:hypothetical protein